MNTITNLSKYGLHTWFMRSMNIAGGRPGRSSRKTFGNYLTTGYEALSGLTWITSGDQSFTVDRNVDDTKNFGMILGQPVHTNEDVETTEFNRHEINYESISSDSFLPSILLLVVNIIVVIVIVVVVGEGSPIIKLSFMIIDEKNGIWRNHFKSVYLFGTEPPPNKGGISR
nr:hypothetical protein [Tanacetum cinerariifolium]